MSASNRTDVLVVGAGPVGMVAALSLAQQGARVRILDEQAEIAARSYALALHPTTLDLFAELGILDELLARGRSLERIAFYERSERRAELKLTELPTRHSSILLVPQAELEAVLLRRLESKRVYIDWNHRLGGLEQRREGVLARVEQLSKDSSGYSIARSSWIVDREIELEAAFVIGADGHRSATRRLLGAEWQEAGRPQLFAVFEFAQQAAATEEARVFIDSEGTGALWPLAAGHYRFSFEIDEQRVAVSQREKSRLAVVVGDDSFAWLEPQLLEELVAERAPWFTLRHPQLIWSMAVPFERRLVSAFGRGWIWLAGDAAHLASPLSGLSMNVGLLEARELAQRIGSVLQRRGRVDGLEDWGQEQHQMWRRLLDPSSIEAGDQASPWARGHVAQLADCIPASGEHRRLLLGQFGLQLRGQAAQAAIEAPTR